MIMDTVWPIYFSSTEGFCSLIRCAPLCCYSTLTCLPRSTDILRQTREGTYSKLSSPLYAHHEVKRKWNPLIKLTSSDGGRLRFFCSKSTHILSNQLGKTTTILVCLDGVRLWFTVHACLVRTSLFFFLRSYKIYMQHRMLGFNSDENIDFFQ